METLALYRSRIGLYAANAGLKSSEGRRHKQRSTGKTNNTKPSCKKRKNTKSKSFTRTSVALEYDTKSVNRKSVYFKTGYVSRLLLLAFILYISDKYSTSSLLTTLQTPVTTNFYSEFSRHGYSAVYAGKVTISKLIITH